MFKKFLTLLIFTLITSFSWADLSGDGITIDDIESIKVKKYMSATCKIIIEETDCIKRALQRSDAKDFIKDRKKCIKKGATKRSKIHDETNNIPLSVLEIAEAIQTVEIMEEQYNITEIAECLMFNDRPFDCYSPSFDLSLTKMQKNMCP